MENTPGQPRRISTRQALLGASVLVAAAFLVYRTLLPDTPRSAAPSRRGRAADGSELPRIGLDRLSSTAPQVKAGRRDLFSFGTGRSEDEDEDGDESASGKPGLQPPPTPVATPNPQVAPPLSPRLVAINLKYVGSLESAGGLKVAVLLTDRNEILYGQVGQHVANRFKILRIGFESVEVLDEGSGQSRRIPFKGN